MNTAEAFLFTLAIGGVISAVVWLVARKSIRRASVGRAAFCLLVAAAVAPACFRFWGDWTVWPAALMLGLVFEGGKNGLFALLYGLPPILILATVLFCASAVIVSRKRGHKTQVV
jgi:hypothetical protein